MLAGLDFGTSNSALGIPYKQSVKLLPLFEEEQFLPSTLYTYDRSFISEYIASKLASEEQTNFRNDRRPQLNQAKQARHLHGFSNNENVIFFGKQAIQNYIETPEDGIFIKSPKSFLGATGLSEKQIQFFEDLVSAMMLNIKQSAETQTQKSISNVVIGRPVNFQGVDSHQSNQQAIQIMTRAAKRCGYREIEFLYEPLAAGIDFESSLNSNKIVLVVDIGGGTTDCSMVKMGPAHINQLERSNDFLAHTGRRIGGNDIDIALAYHQLMPHFGKGSYKKKGIEVPSGPFWSAVSINNIGEQTRFNSLNMRESLIRTKREAQKPELIERLLQLQKHKLNHRLVRNSELAKIDLTNNTTTECQLDYLTDSLTPLIKQQDFESAITAPMESIKKLINECVQQAGTHPDVIYITGGSAKSPVLRKAIDDVMPSIDILDGDYYGSVAAGLTKWAARIWN